MDKIQTGKNVEVKIIDKENFEDFQKVKYRSFDELWEPTSDELILLEEIFKAP
jgi:hypothetical protein